MNNTEERNSILQGLAYKAWMYKNLITVNNEEPKLNWYMRILFLPFNFFRRSVIDCKRVISTLLYSKLLQHRFLYLSDNDMFNKCSTSFTWQLQMDWIIKFFRRWSNFILINANVTPYASISNSTLCDFVRRIISPNILTLVNNYLDRSLNYPEYRIMTHCSPSNTEHILPWSP
jgi:hypothetical protein